MNTLSQIKEHKLIAIIRGANPNDVIKIAEALYAGGVRLLEITMNSEAALEVIEKTAKAMVGRMTIGAGTVLDAETAKKAVKAGAHFILSPTVSKKTIKVSKELGVVSIPGAYTPTEIFKAYSYGGDIIKVFPASDPSYIKNVMGPLSHIPMLPTGGVNLENIQEFKKLGVVGYGIGSSLVDTKKEVTDQYLSELTEKARRYVEAVK